MVDVSNIGTISMLSNELNRLAQAFEIIDGNGRITSMTWATPINEGEWVNTVTLSTADIAYPPQMVDAIKDALTARQQQIEDDLAGFGVTGVDMTGRAAPVERGAHK